MCFIKANKIFMDLQRVINPSKHNYNRLSGTCVSGLINHDREMCGLDITGNLSKYSESHDLKDLILDVMADVFITLALHPSY